MAGVRALGYVGLRADAPEAWRAFGADVLGMPAASGVEDGPLRLRMDERAYRIEVMPRVPERPEEVLAHVGWECSSEDAWSRVLEQVTKFGRPVELATEDQCRLQGVRGLGYTTDPEGYRLHIFYGANLGELPFAPTRPIGDFVTQGVGLGHIVLRVGNLAETSSFYTTALGFRPTDYWSGIMTFLRCNSRHHSLGLVGGTGGQLLFHMMVEVNTVDAVGLTQAACEKHGVELTMTLGRHMNDRMLSFYMRSPSGCEVEYGCDPIVIDEATWSVREFPDRSVWGHRPLVARTLQAPGDIEGEQNG